MLFCSFQYTQTLVTLLSTVTLLLVAAIEFSQLLLANASRLAGLRGAAGASGLCWFGAVAAWWRSLQEVLGNGTLQVLHGGGSSHADNPRVFKCLARSQTLSGIHREDTVNEVLSKIGNTRPWLSENRREQKIDLDYSDILKTSHLCQINTFQQCKINFKLIFLFFWHIFRLSPCMLWQLAEH